jgi:hypothetical protein
VSQNSEPTTQAYFSACTRSAGIPRPLPIGFQAQFRAGIRQDAYQLLPLRKALRLPSVNLLIADDVGAGKTVERAWFVHQNFRGQGTTGTASPCREQMWLEDAGTSAEPKLPEAAMAVQRPVCRSGSLVPIALSNSAARLHRQSRRRCKPCVGRRR